MASVTSSPASSSSPTPEAASPIQTKQQTPPLFHTPPTSAKDLFSPIESTTPTSTVLTVSARLEDGEEIMTSKANIASTSRTHSPSPLLWNESGWNAGNFTFSPFSNEDSNKGMQEGEGGEEGKGRRFEQERRSSTNDSDKSSSLHSSTTPSSASAEEGKKEEGMKKKSTSGFSKLAPTAQPFVFSPKPTQHTPTVSTPPFARLSPLTTTSVPRHSSLPFPATSSHSSNNSPLEPPHSAMPRFNTSGQFLDKGSRYNIAEEILQLQGGGFEGVGNQVEELSTYDSFCEGADGGGWTAEQQQHFNSMFASPYEGSPERSRSSSNASSSSFFGSYRSSIDRNATVQQHLTSYFGPSPVDIAPLNLPAGFDNFTPHLSRTSSMSSFDSQIYPPLAHPEPFNLTPEDPLYIQAREIYTTSCCSTLKTAPPPAKLWEIGEYFDKAMNQENPLAALYGVNSEQTKGFYANPATSGLNEVVVKVAAMRGRQNQMLSVQRSAAGQILPGPSPNNRKLELYKTELCRSWEEKGSCRYGFKCQFAHGRDEQRSISRHPKFKSELCRTFAVNGSCPYGPRCCFIHQALPGGGRRSSAPPSGQNSRSDSPAESVSRLAHRMTSSAVAGAPQRNFGPLLSNYIGSNGSSVNGSALSSLTNSPTQSFRPQLSSAPSPVQEDSSFCDPFGDANVGLGLSLKMGQAPPVHQEPAKSRIHRYSLSSQNSSTSLSSLAHSSSSGTTSPTVGFHPHARTHSNNSTYSSVSSAVSALSSPCLQRHGSQSSLSSAGGGPPSSPLALRPMSSSWLGHHASPTKPEVFDWPETEDLIATEDSHGSPIASRFNGLSLY